MKKFPSVFVIASLLLSGCGASQTALVNKNSSIINADQKGAYEQAGYVCEPILELSQENCVDIKVGKACAAREVNEEGYKCEKVTNENVDVSADLP